MNIGIVAPSSQVPQIELSLGVQKIKDAGFNVRVHRQCKKSHLFFAGDDESRAQAFFEYAFHSEVDVIWCARGGYGSVRLLPILQKLTETQGVPKPKLLVGYSDVTALMGFVQKHWGWQTLHCPLPSLRKFSILPEQDWALIQNWIQKNQVKAHWETQRLKFWSSAPSQRLTGELVGGNLTVWTSLIGTPYEIDARGKILFFEDIDEALYRIDRMLQQLLLSGSLSQVKAIVLGNFLNCKDYSASVLAKSPQGRRKHLLLESPKPQDLKPLRRTYEPQAALKKIWGDLGKQLGIPVLFGLPVGHGPDVSPLPLGAHYELSPQGYLKLMKWGWFQ